MSYSSSEKSKLEKRSLIWLENPYGEFRIISQNGGILRLFFRHSDLNHNCRKQRDNSDQ